MFNWDNPDFLNRVLVFNQDFLVRSISLPNDISMAIERVDHVDK